MQGACSMPEVEVRATGESAQQRVIEFYKLYNEERFAELFEMFRIDQRDPFTNDQLIDSFRMRQAKVGLVLKPQLLRTEVYRNVFGTSVTIVVKVEYEKTTSVEQFDCIVVGQDIRFTYYGELADR